MGTGQSKGSPNEQMRMKMENGFNEEEDDSDIEALGIPGVDKGIRSKSNISFHTSDRLQNDSDDYFNQIYNKNGERTLNSLNGSAVVVKSAPVGTKKEKDPEVAAAIAELEETFKVLGDAPIAPPENSVENKDKKNLEGSHSNPVRLSTHDWDSSNPNSSSSEGAYDSSSRTNSGSDVTDSESSEKNRYDRHLVSRAGDTHIQKKHEQRAYIRRHSNLLELSSPPVGCTSYSSSGCSNPAMLSRGSDHRGFIVSSHSIVRPGKTHSPQSVLMQQRREFQIQKRNAETLALKSSSAEALSKDDWKYEPPKIDGFDIEKFKEINATAKLPPATVVPVILREDEDDNGYHSRSPDIPAYTKDELDLIATLEREVY